MTRRTCSRLYLATLPLIPALLTTPARADYQRFYFVGPPTAVWSDPNNWSPDPNAPGGGTGVPGTRQDSFYDSVTVSVATPTALTIDVDSLDVGGCGFNGSPDAPLTVTQAGNFFYASNIFVGSNTTFLQPTGNIRAHTSIGVYDGGTYSVSGPEARARALFEIYVGAGGNFYQSGGFVGTSSIITIHGTYTLSGGNFGTEELSINGTPNAPATFVQTGGLGGAMTNVFLGKSATYSLAGGSVSGGRITIGNSTLDTTPGAGSYFNQSGGTVVVPYDTGLRTALAISSDPANPAVYNLSGGAVRFEQLLYNPEYTAPLLIANAPNSVGTFVQSGGTVGGDGTPATSTDRPYQVTVGVAAGATGTYLLSAGTLATANLTVGYAGTGSFAQTGGTVSLAPLATYAPTSALTLAQSPGSSATYSLSGGTLAATTLVIADHGTGTFSQSGGTVSVTASYPTLPYLTIASAAGSSGTYALSDGSLRVLDSLDVGGRITVGAAGDGTLVQSGGSINTRSLSLGTSPGGTGTYLLSGGAIGTNNGAIVIGDSGTGRLLHSGGTINYSLTNLLVGNNGGTGTYEISGTAGAFVGSLVVGGSGYGHVRQTGGVLSSVLTSYIGSSAGDGSTYELIDGKFHPDYLIVGGGGIGTLSQSGGELRTYGVILGDAPGANGLFTLSGGTLSIGDLFYIGYRGAGTLIQTNGSVDARGRVVSVGREAGSSGSYSLSGTGSLVCDTLLVGEGGAGTFAQAGGTAQTIFALVRAGGQHTLSAGTLSTSAADVAGTFTQTGGSATAATLTIHPSAAVNVLAGSLAVGTIDNAGTFSQSGGTLTLTGSYPNYPSLTIGSSAGSAGLYALSGTGFITDPTDFASLKVGDAGTGTFTLSDSAFAAFHNVTLGNSSTGAGTLLQTGGNLHTANLIIGNAGTGTLVQSAGRVTAYNSLVVGAGSHGTVSLSGTASFSGYMSEFVGNGEVVQTGGFNYSAGTLYVGGGTGSHGSYTLAGGTVSVDYLYLLGSGSFLQTGGSVSTYGVRLNPAAGSSAAYTLAGGTIETYSDYSYVGGAGPATFTHTGGTFTLANNLNIGSGSFYSLSDTGTLAADRLVVYGSFYQSGGTANAFLSIATTGHYVLSGGTLGYGTSLSGTLTQTGGSAHFTGYTAIQPSAIYDLLGGSLTTSMQLNAGTFYMAPGTSFTFTGHTFTNNGSATFDGLQSWPDGSTFSNTLVAYFHSDPGSPTRAPLSVTSDSPAWAPLVFDAPATHLASLALHGSSHATLPPSPGSPRLLSTLALTIDPAASLDLANNTLLLSYASSSPIDTIRQYLHDALLASSSAEAAHRLAYADTGSAVTVSLALTGDATLDGRVNADDYTLLDRSFARSLPNAHWQDGDFNYDGTVNAADYLLIDTAFGQAQGFTPGFLAQREQQFGADYVSSLLTTVPEPTSVACLLTASLLVSRRRWC